MGVMGVKTVASAGVHGNIVSRSLAILAADRATCLGPSSPNTEEAASSRCLLSDQL